MRPKADQDFETNNSLTHLKEAKTKQHERFYLKLHEYIRIEIIETLNHWKVSVNCVNCKGLACVFKPMTYIAHLLRFFHSHISLE